MASKVRLDYWCMSCQEFVEPIYVGPTLFPTGPRCPTCKRGVSNRPPDAKEPIINVGNWNVTDFGWVIGACHDPTIDRLMTTLRELERAMETDPQLANARDHARAKAMAYLLSHKSLLIIESR